MHQIQNLVSWYGMEWMSWLFGILLAHQSMNERTHWYDAWNPDRSHLSQYRQWGKCIRSIYLVGWHLSVVGGVMIHTHTETHTRWLYLAWIGISRMEWGSPTTIRWQPRRRGDGAQSNRCAFYSSQVESRAQKGSRVETRLNSSIYPHYMV